MKVFISLLLCLCFNGSAWTQDDWHTYPFREISALISQEETLYNSTKPKADIVVSAKPFPAKTRVIFSGSKRPISGNTKSFIGIWFETRGLPAAKAAILAEEYLFREKDQEFWIPVQTNVSPDLERNLKPGDEILIYYFYLGGFNGQALDSKSISKDKTSNPETGGVRWIFVVEKFEKLAAQFQLQSLAGVVQSAASKKVEGIWYDPENVKSKVKVQFSGKVREVSGKRKILRDLWFERIGFPEGASGLMDFEAQFIEGEKDYWIAIRNRTLEQLKQNVRKGDSILLNTILAGAIKDKDQVDWFFLAGEYSTF